MSYGFSWLSSSEAQYCLSYIQGYGRYLWLMNGMFRSNGGCGFVKKPDFLMKGGPHGEVFNPKTKFPVKKSLKVSAPTTFLYSFFPGGSKSVQCDLTGESIHGWWMALGFQTDSFWLIFPTRFLYQGKLDMHLFCKANFTGAMKFISPSMHEFTAKSCFRSALQECQVMLSWRKQK